VSVHGSPWRYYVPLKLLNADPDSAFHSNADPDLDPASKNNAYPDPQIWLILCTCGKDLFSSLPLKEDQQDSKKTRGGMRIICLNKKIWF
jgi:hypothetical protein